MRNEISFKDVNITRATWTGAGLNAASTGKACTIVAPGCVGLGSDGDALLGGISVFESDGKVTITDSGYMELPALTKLNCGDSVVVDGSGNVKAGSAIKAKPFVVDNTDWATTGKVVVLA